MSDRLTRRMAFRGFAAGAAALFGTRGAFAYELSPTPRVTEGPYYPDKLPLDTDNDLLIVNEDITPAVGEITWLSGQVFTRAGSPLRGAVVEIWQVDGKGAYLNTSDPAHARFDRHFQGYGRFLTDAEGRYSFRTLKPVRYPGRAPHIHMAVNLKGKRALTTQILVAGAPENARDMVLNEVRDPAARASLIVPFAPLAGSRIGELAAKFDVVLGFTPEAPDAHDEPRARPQQPRTSERRWF